MGLNDNYTQTRSQILLRSLFPTINQAYAMMIEDESQKIVAATTCVLGGGRGGDQGNAQHNFEIAMYARTGNTQTAKSKRNYNLMCEVCKKRGHNKEVCYRVTGYPPDFKSQRKGLGNTIYSAHLVQSQSEFDRGNQNMQGPIKFNYPHNTNVYNQNLGQCSRSKSQPNMRPVSQNLESYVFT